MHFHCRDDLAQIYYEYVCPPIYILCAVTTLPCIYVYIQAHCTRRKFKPSLLFYSGLLLYLLIFAVLSIGAWLDLVTCGERPPYVTLQFLVDNGYVVQNAVILAILFLRLHVIFKESIWRLSRVTVWLFAALWILIVVLALFAAVVWLRVDENALFALVAPCALVIYLLETIWLVALYIYKLNKLHSSSDTELNNNGRILHVITKTSLLCFVSASTILWRIVVFVLLYEVDSPHFQVFVFELVFVAELVTNFVCIWLSYSFADATYRRVCGFCHAQCLKLCDKKHAKETFVLKEVQSAIEPTATSTELTNKSL